MLFIDNRGLTDPRLNLALEEYVLRHRPVEDDCLLFYVNAPSIIVGRNQNTIEEINPDVVAARGVRVVRRISGGGAVYHDLGNLNFSFVAPYVPGRFNRYEHFTRPVVEVLRGLGVPAELGGRNDILAGGRKISGNAQFATAGRMFSHGTLLVDSRLDDVVEALRPRPGKVESKGMKSIRSRVANIGEFTAEPLTVDALRDRILERLFGTAHLGRVPQLALDDADWSAVRALAARKYYTWEWNFGENPPSNVQRARRFPAGEVDVRLDVQKGRIAGIRIYGDFQGREETAGLQARLLGVPFDREPILAALTGVDLADYFGEVEPGEVLELLLP